MTTALDLINLAQKAVGTLGVGQSLLAEDINDAFASLKQMLSIWQRKRWLVYALEDVCNYGNDIVSNPIGPGQYYDTDRPDKIQAAYVRLNGIGNQFDGGFDDGFLHAPLSSSVDYPLIEIPSYEDYSRIALKGLNSFPTRFFYDAAYPYGNVYIWPIPSSSYEIHLIKKVGLQNLTIPASVLSFPPEYEEAIWSNLAIRLCAFYQISATRELVAIAKTSLNTIRIANAQIPELVMPNSLNFGSSYNIYSDAGYRF